MRVFLSWSGERSKQVAELLNTWLKCTIQSLQPWISTRGIGRGELWFPAINRELAETSVGIVCLTRENLNAPWILFEAGSLAKGLDSNRVITFLIDLEPGDINDPLAQFNHTLPIKDSMFQLLNTVNALSANPLDSKIVELVFDKYWDEFENNFNEILNQTTPGPKPKKPTSEEVLDQILSALQNLERINRSSDTKSEFSQNSSNEPGKDYGYINSILRMENDWLKKEINQLKINSMMGLNIKNAPTDNDL
ncbi:hypothetical protein ACP6L2_01215 [Sphingobacterium lactis]|uniref:hypothetical protein n=1 Tax=Sphingobacterium lactis TaxID=797291 RepID=UPI003F7DDE57